MATNWNSINSQRLIKVISSFKYPDELRLLLDDLLTENEISEIIRRLEAATWLYACAPYEAITNITGLSSKTISKISKKMINKKGGYWLAIHKLYPRGYQSYTEPAD